VIKNLSNRHRQAIEKLLLGLINVGNLAVAFVVLSGPALWYSMRNFLNPTPYPTTAWDHIADAILLPFPWLKYFLLVGSMAAFFYLFLVSERKDKWFFGATSVAMLAIAVFYLGLGRG